MSSATDVEIDKIILDTGNPRIKHFLEMYPDPELSEEQMLLALGAGAEHEGNTDPQGSYERLKNSIRASGGIIQPIILKTYGDGLYLCIEGNTRVAIYRELRKYEQDTGRSHEKWSTIPAIINEEMEDLEAHKIRLQVHLVGNRAWDPYSKAKYLHELREVHKMPMSELVDFCGGSKRDVQQSLAAYRDMETHYRTVLNEEEDFDPSDFDPSRFSAFVELQKPGIKDAIFKAGYDETHFSRWVDKKKVSPLNSVRKLPQILENSEAKRTFLQVGAREAIKKLDAPNLDTKLQEASISQLSRALQEKIDTLPYNEAKQIASDSESEAYLDLKDVLACVEELMRLDNGLDE